MPGLGNEPQKPERTRPLFFANRVRAMGTTGWEGYGVGFTLVAYILATAGLGWWLDQKFHTSFCLPVLMLIGLVAGFREMFVTLGRMNRREEKRRREASQARASQVKLDSQPILGSDGAKTEEAPVRQRSFQVPPPPLPGQKLNPAPSSSEDDAESIEKLLGKLLAESKADEAEDEKQP